MNTDFVSNYCRDMESVSRWIIFRKLKSSYADKRADKLLMNLNFKFVKLIFQLRYSSINSTRNGKYNE